LKRLRTGDRRNFLFGIRRFFVLASIVTRVEHLVRTARALLPGLPDQAYGILVDAAAETADPRLRYRLRGAVSSIGEGDPRMARRLLDRAVEYLDARAAARM
jgi:hypothetical protein